MYDRLSVAERQTVSSGASCLPWEPLSIMAATKRHPGKTACRPRFLNARISR